VSTTWTRFVRKLVISVSVIKDVGRLSSIKVNREEMVDLTNLGLVDVELIVYDLFITNANYKISEKNPFNIVKL